MAKGGWEYRGQVKVIPSVRYILTNIVEEFATGFVKSNPSATGQLQVKGSHSLMKMKLENERYGL